MDKSPAEHTALRGFCWLCKTISNARRVRPSREKETPERPQTLRCTKDIKVISAEYGQSAAEAILNRLYAKKDTARSGVIFSEREPQAMLVGE